MKKKLSVFLVLCLLAQLLGAVGFAAEGDPTEPTEHTCVPASDWSSDASSHWLACTVEGCGKKLGERNHYGGSGNGYKSDKNQHWWLCGTCSHPYSYDSHDYWWDGSAYSCSCGRTTDVSNIPHGNAGGLDGRSDTHHWNTCRVHDCTEHTYNYAPHSFDNYREDVGVWECECGMRSDSSSPSTGCPDGDHTPVVDPGYDSTCTEPGMSDGIVCGACGTVLQRKEPTPPSHNRLGDRKTLAVTCTTDGASPEFYCLDCGVITRESEVIPATGHNWIELKGSHDNCLLPGRTDGRYCTNCERIEGYEVIPAYGEHMWHTYPADQPACESFGWGERTVCVRCDVYQNDQYPDRIYPTGHDPVPTGATEPDCTTPGYEDGTICARCGKTLSGREETAEPLGHDWKIITPAREATCKQLARTAYEQCTRCLKTISPVEYGELAPHTPEHFPERPALCGFSGYTEGSQCSVCGHTCPDEACGHGLYAQQVIPALEHHHVYVDEIGATCTESYIFIYQCDQPGVDGPCGDEIRKPHGKSFGHRMTEEISRTEPTCTEPGSVTLQCINVFNGVRCTETTHEFLPKAEHAWGEWYYDPAYAETAAQAAAANVVLPESGVSGSVEKLLEDYAKVFLFGERSDEDVGNTLIPALKGQGYTDTECRNIAYALFEAVYCASNNASEDSEMVEAYRVRVDDEGLTPELLDYMLALAQKVRGMTAEELGIQQPELSDESRIKLGVTVERFLDQINDGNNLDAAVKDMNKSVGGNGLDYISELSENQKDCIGLLAGYYATGGMNEELLKSLELSNYSLEDQLAYIRLHLGSAICDQIASTVQNPVSNETSRANRNAVYEEALIETLAVIGSSELAGGMAFLDVNLGTTAVLNEARAAAMKLAFAAAEEGRINWNDVHHIYSKCIDDPQNVNNSEYSSTFSDLAKENIFRYLQEAMTRIALQAVEDGTVSIEEGETADMVNALEDALSDSKAIFEKFLSLPEEQRIILDNSAAKAAGAATLQALDEASEEAGDEAEGETDIFTAVTVRDGSRSNFTVGELISGSISIEGLKVGMKQKSTAEKEGRLISQHSRKCAGCEAVETQPCPAYDNYGDSTQLCSDCGAGNPAVRAYAVVDDSYSTIVDPIGGDDPISAPIVDPIDGDNPITAPISRAPGGVSISLPIRGVSGGISVSLPIGSAPGGEDGGSGGGDFWVKDDPVIGYSGDHSWFLRGENGGSATSGGYTFTVGENAQIVVANPAGTEYKVQKVTVSPLTEDEASSSGKSKFVDSVIGNNVSFNESIMDATEHESLFQSKGNGSNPRLVDGIATGDPAPADEGATTPTPQDVAESFEFNISNAGEEKDAWKELPSHIDSENLMDYTGFSAKMLEAAGIPADDAELTLGQLADLARTLNSDQLVFLEGALEGQKNRGEEFEKLLVAMMDLTDQLKAAEAAQQQSKPSEGDPSGQTTDPAPATGDPGTALTADDLARALIAVNPNLAITVGDPAPDAGEGQSADSAGDGGHAPWCNGPNSCNCSAGFDPSFTWDGNHAPDCNGPGHCTCGTESALAGQATDPNMPVKIADSTVSGGTYLTDGVGSEDVKLRLETGGITWFGKTVKVTADDVASTNYNMIDLSSGDDAVWYFYNQDGNYSAVGLNASQSGEDQNSLEIQDRKEKEQEIEEKQDKQENSGGSFDFTDQDQITGTDAADWVNPLRAAEGYTDGTYGPQNTVTRGEAAKMIAYTILGKDVAEARASQYNEDNPEANWAAGYIAYCTGIGIMDGSYYGAFDPDEEVSGSELAKMLLVAAGYSNDATVISGADWDRIAYNSIYNSNGLVSADSTIESGKTYYAGTTANAGYMNLISYVQGTPQFTSGQNFKVTLQDVGVTVDENGYAHFTADLGASYLFTDETLGRNEVKPKAEEPKEETTTYTVTARNLNVRGDASTENAPVGQLNRGDTVNVVSIEGDWAKLSDGTYVNARYLTRENSADWPFDHA